MPDGGYPYPRKKPNGTGCTCSSSLFCLQRAVLTLNIQKCDFLQEHIVDAQGVNVNTHEKTHAIGHFPTPTTVTELQRFMGMTNQMGKFVPGLADIDAPLQQLLRKDSAWYWNEAQQTAFQQVKEKFASPEVLAHYNSNHHSHCCRCTINRAWSSSSNTR